MTQNDVQINAQQDPRTLTYTFMDEARMYQKTLLPDFIFVYRRYVITLLANPSSNAAAHSIYTAKIRELLGSSIPLA